MSNAKCHSYARNSTPAPPWSVCQRPSISSGGGENQFEIRSNTIASLHVSIALFILYRVFLAARAFRNSNSSPVHNLRC